jgi:hypothetical protein
MPLFDKVAGGECVSDEVAGCKALVCLWVSGCYWCRSAFRLKRYRMELWLHDGTWKKPSCSHGSVDDAPCDHTEILITLGRG